MVSKKSQVTTYKKGGNSLNPFIKLFVFLIILGLFVIPVNAIIYENLVEDPVGLGYYSPTTMLEIESTCGLITVFNPSGTGSLDVKIYDLPTPEDAQIGADGLIYFVLRDGRVFQCTDASYTSFDTDYNTSFILLGDVDATDVNRQLVVDDGNNVYVNSGTDVIKFTYPSFASSEYDTFSYTVDALGNHKDGLLVGLSHDGTTAVDPEGWIYLTDGSTQTLLHHYGPHSADSNSDGELTGLYSTTNGDVYFTNYYRHNTVSTWYHKGYLNRLECADSWSVSTISTIIDVTGVQGDSSVSHTPSDIYINSAGIIYGSFTFDDTIKTYATVGLSGGYSAGIVGEIEGSYINWDSSYVLGDTGAYTWGWDADDKSLLRSEKVKIYKDGVLLDTITVGDTGTRYYDLNEVGNYLVSLVTTFPFTSDQIYAADSIDVTEAPDSYINVPQTAYTAESFAISYMYGRTPLGPFLKVSKQIPSETGDYIYVNVDADYLKDQNIVAGTVYTPNLTIFESGTYLIGIYDINLLTESRSMLIASDTIKIFYQDAISRINITESKIDTANVTTIGLGDTLFGNYQVDSLNYTTGPIRLEMYNYENDVISFSMPKQAQKGSYELPIKNLEYFVEVKDGHETVYKVDALFYTGNNQVRLARYDPDGTYNQTLAYTNVTIDYVNSAGYSLTLSKYMVVQNEPFTISVKCPTTSRLVIFDDTGYAINNINLSGNTNIPYSLSSEGKYSIQLYDPSTNLQCIELITVNEGVRPDDDVEEEPTQNTIEMVIMFLSMPAFWGMVIWVGVVGGSAQKVSGNATGYIAFLFANLLAVVGLFAPYTIYIVLITWIAAGIFFKLGRDAAGGE